jgi:hypothetical protein
MDEGQLHHQILCHVFPEAHTIIAERKLHTGISMDSQDTLLFSALSCVSSMNEIFPLALAHSLQSEV